MNWKTVPAVLVVLVLAGPAWADYDAGKRAMEAGRVAEALEQWRTAAASEDRRAMLELGRLFVRGLGVPQNYVRAHAWLNLAAARGEAAAAQERDALAAKMTPTERAEAQKLALDWRPGTPKKETQARTETVPEAPAGPPPARAIRQAQALLAALGYKPGPADGKWGRRTAAAHAAFLRDAGLPPADALTPQVLSALRSAAARHTATAPKAAPKPRGSDALLQAAINGDIDGLKAALKAGVEVNARDDRGRTALMHAADKGYTLLVRPLLAAKADPNLRAPDGATALFVAALRGHSEIVALLMKAGADISIKGPKGKTAVDVARLRYGTVAVARKEGVDPAVVALLVGLPWKQARQGTSPDCDDWVKRKFWEKADDLLVKRCLAAGAVAHARNENEYGRTPLYFAPASTIKALVAAGADVGARDTDGKTPLHAAAEGYGDAKKIEVLIAAGADVGARDESRETPLHVAASYPYDGLCGKDQGPCRCRRGCQCAGRERRNSAP